MREERNNLKIEFIIKMQSEHRILENLNPDYVKNNNNKKNMFKRENQGCAQAIV